MSRFWDKVDERGPDDCWLWTARTDRYGRFRVASKMKKAHRVAYELSVGPIPEGLGVLHHCDVPACCNPAHLYLGTPKDNARDRTSRGRGNHLTGEDAPNAKLPDADVTEIRRRYALGGISQQALADEFGIVQPHVSRLVHHSSRMNE